MNKMEQSENIEIFYWEKMNAIIIPSKSRIFFEGVEPFKQINSDGAHNSTFIHSDNYINRYNVKHWVVYCPTINDKVNIIISERDLELLSLNTKEDVYNIMKLLQKISY